MASGKERACMSTIESPPIHRPPHVQSEVPRVSETEAIDLLIADDDTDFRGSVARRFLRRGYRVQEASDGLEALALADRRHFDVALLDMVMPGMTGVELLKKLKAQN